MRASVDVDLPDRGRIIICGIVASVRHHTDHACLVWRLKRIRWRLVGTVRIETVRVLVNQIRWHQFPPSILIKAIVLKICLARPLIR